MPIRPEYRKFYDARWRRFRLTVIEAAGGKCQACRREHRMLNVAHLAHDPARQGRARGDVSELPCEARRAAEICGDAAHLVQTPEAVMALRRNRTGSRAHAIVTFAVTANWFV